MPLSQVRRNKKKTDGLAPLDMIQQQYHIHFYQSAGLIGMGFSTHPVKKTLHSTNFVYSGFKTYQAFFTYTPSVIHIPRYHMRLKYFASISLLMLAYQRRVIWIFFLACLKCLILPPNDYN